MLLLFSRYRRLFVSSHTILFMVYFMMINIPLLAGLVGYGDDTGAFDFPFRILSSQLSEYKDTLLWYPYAGDGVPQLSLEYVGLTWNPIGVLLGLFSSYDYQTLAVEIIMWRATGAVGSYALARHWKISPIGSTAVAATYIGSGTMSRAALSLITLIGQMLAPWILYTGLRIIDARTIRDSVIRIIHFSTFYGILLWCGYAATALILPVLLAPLFLHRAYVTKTSPIQLLTSFSGSLILILAFISPLLYETFNGPIDHLSSTYRSSESSMLVGNTRSIDFIGLLLPNPSYALPDGSDDLQPLYSGVIPIIVFISTARFIRIFAHRSYPLFFLLFIFYFLLSLPNLADYYKMFFYDKTFVYTLIHSPHLWVFFSLFLPLFFATAHNNSSVDFSPLDKIFVFTLLLITFLSTDNPVANYLRNTAPPFSLVRHNFLWYWLYSLIITIFAWSKLDTHFNQNIFPNPSNNYVPRTSSLTQALNSHFLYGSFSLLLITILYIAPHNVPETIARTLFVGKTHLMWQLLTVGVLLTLLAAVLFIEFRAPTEHRNTLFFLLLLVPCIIYFLCAHLIGPTLRSARADSLTLALTDIQRFQIDFLHIFLITSLFLAAIMTPAIRSLRPLLVLSLILIDMGVATHRYYYDNDRFSTPQQGWPWNYTNVTVRAKTNNFQPHNANGRYKGDIWQPFTGTVRPYPAVDVLRHEWGSDYQTWVHFPSAWYESPNGIDVTVLKDALPSSRGFIPPDWTPTWGVNAAATGGRNTKPNYPQLSEYEANLLSSSMSINYPCNASNISDATMSDFTLNYMLSTEVSLTTYTTCPRLLLFTDSWSASWQATVNGNRTTVYRANKAIRALLVPAGSNVIIWNYDTSTLFLLAIFPISMLLLALMFLIYPLTFNKNPTQ